jgi:signal transduction histidine kinase
MRGDDMRGESARGEGPIGGGLGLGLYIVQQIAAAHGGGVTVKNEAGTVTFAVTLPLLFKRA